MTSLPSDQGQKYYVDHPTKSRNFNMIILLKKELLVYFLIKDRNTISIIQRNLSNFHWSSSWSGR